MFSAARAELKRLNEAETAARFGEAQVLFRPSPAGVQAFGEPLWLAKPQRRRGGPTVRREGDRVAGECFIDMPMLA